MGASTAWGGLPEGIHSYPGMTGRSTQYHLGPRRLVHCRQELFLPQEAPLPTRAADLSKCCYNNLPQDAQSGHCCDKLWAWDGQALWMVMPRPSTSIVPVVCEVWSRSWVSSIRKYTSQKPAGYCLTRSVKGPSDPSPHTHVR